MAEVPGEAQKVWSAKAHIAIFLSAVRHFRDRLRDDGIRVDYREMDDLHNRGSLGAELRRAVETWRPKRVIVVQPGEWRVQRILLDAAERVGVPLEMRPDRHFLCPLDLFDAHAEGRRRLLMEPFYRAMRRRTDALMDGDEPTGGAWNYDEQNRESFGPEGPGPLPAPRAFHPDATTRQLIPMRPRARC